MKRSWFFFPLLVLLFSAGCATLPPRVTPVSLLPLPLEGVYHIVGTGDTLWQIARDYDVDMHDIMQVNRIRDAGRLIAGQTLVIPQPVTPSPVALSGRPLPLSRVIEKKIGVKHPLSKWRTITLHHSATDTGNAASFHRDHKKRRMGGLFYHFVIGNETGSGDGEVEVGWRWKRQVKSNRPYDIQVCLVGDFNKQDVSKKQFQSLVSLIHLLRKQYNIPLRHVRRHRDIRGKTTECPGRRFPFYWVLSELRKQGRRS